jgi:hypothetical protein
MRGGQSTIAPPWIGRGAGGPSADRDVRYGIPHRGTVVFPGDCIDRGADSKGCIDRILRFRTGSPATVVTLVGNHEDWRLRTMWPPERRVVQSGRF